MAVKAGHTKTNAVLKYLEENGSISSLEAFNLCFETRLSAIIYNLRKYGYDIESVDEESEGEYGKSIYTRYILHKKEDK